MSSNDLEGNTSALQEIYAANAGTEPGPFWDYPPTFSTGCRKKRIATLECELL